MSENNVVKIHGKDYMTVAGRVESAHEVNEKTLSITTELVSSDPVLFKATVLTSKGTFTGYSASYGDPKKPIEKQSPYEVAETSAVGRALGFAGYGIVEGIASADEMKKADTETPREQTRVSEDSDVKVCSQHEDPILMKKGTSKSTGKEYWYHRNDIDQICFGQGYQN